jgi:Arc/MetJ family transcription regulator
MRSAPSPMYVKESRFVSNSLRTTIDIDDALMREAMRLSGLATKKAVVEAALRLLIQTRPHASALDVKGVDSEVSTTDPATIAREGRKRR